MGKEVSVSVIRFFFFFYLDQFQQCGLKLAFGQNSDLFLQRGNGQGWGGRAALLATHCQDATRLCLSEHAGWEEQVGGHSGRYPLWGDDLDTKGQLLVLFFFFWFHFKHTHTNIRKRLHCSPETAVPPSDLRWLRSYSGPSLRLDLAWAPEIAGPGSGGVEGDRGKPGFAPAGPAGAFAGAHVATPHLASAKTDLTRQKR